MGKYNSTNMFEAQITNDIRLVLVNKACIPEYVRIAAEDFDYLSEWLEWPRFCVTAEDFGKFVTDSISAYESGASMNCAIEYKGSIAGVAGFNTLSRKLCRVEIGYWIASEYQGNGIVTEVCRYLIKYAFENLDIDVALISAAANNLPSRAVCERLGMTLEGVISNDERVGEKVLDHAKYTIRRV